MTPTMTGEKLQYQLTLATVATGTGARDTAREMEKVGASTKQAEDASKRFLTAAEAEAQKVQQLIQKAQALTAAKKGVITSTYDANQALLAQAAMIKRQNDAFDEARRTNNKFTASSVSMRMGLQNVGYQLQDVAVQAEMGVSATRIISQQLPQLLGGFGAFGALAGAAVAVAVPLVSKLFDIGKASQIAAIGVDEMNAAIEDANSRLIEGMTGGLDAQIRDMGKLRESIAETEKAEGEAAKSTLANDEKLRQAKVSIAEALGLQIDKYKEIELRADAEAKKRKLEADQAVAAEQGRLQKARQDRADAQAAVATERQKQQEVTAALQKAEQELASVRAERARLQATADKGGGIFNDPVENAEARIAQNKLDGVLSKQKLAELENLVKQLTASAEEFEGPNGTLRDVNVNLQEAINKETDIANAVAIKVDELKNSEAIANEIAKFDEIKAKQEQQATDLKAAVTQIETTTETGRAAKAAIEAAAADGRITANESQQVAQASGQIIGQIQAGLATTSGNTQQVLGILRTVAEQEAKNGREIQSLKQQVGQLFSRLR